MEPLGSHLFLLSGSSRHANCICTDGRCKQLTKDFQSLNDARGNYFELPRVGVRQAELKQFKLERTLHHLGLGKDNIEQYKSKDVRDQGSVVTPSASTRKKKQETKRAPTCVAVWHYHPEVVQAMVVDQKIRSSDYLTKEFVKDAGLLGRGYTAPADVFKGKLTTKDKEPVEVFVPVPSYNYDNANDDYELAANRKKLLAVIKSCQNAKYGHRFLSPRASDGMVTPAKKMARPSPCEDVDDLRHAICLLAKQNEALMEKLTEAQAEITELKGQQRGNNAAIEAFVQGTKVGVNRLNISSNRYHEKNRSVAKVYFRFEDSAKGSKLSSWDITKQFLHDMFNVTHEEPTIEMIQHPNGKAKRLTEFETCLVALIFFQNAWDFDHIGSIFGIDYRLVSKCVKAWAPHFCEVGYHMARLPLSKKFLDGSYPQTYVDLNFSSPVGSVVDGTDVFVESVRVQRAVLVMQASDKVKRSAVRGCTWSTPHGMVHEFTDPVFARASEKALVQLWTKHGRLADIPVGYLISADKGFDGTSGCYPNYNPVMHPAFLTGGNGAQFDVAQLDWNKKACEMRYTSEVVFTRVKKYGGLGGIVRRRHFHYLRDLWAWAHGMANDYNCLQMPANNDYFPQSKYSKKAQEN